MSKILSLDYGRKNIGLAISDEYRKLAVPYRIITFQKFTSEERSNLLRELKRIIEDEDIERLVVGLPLTAKGEPTKLADEILEFIGKLKNIISCPVEAFDERQTTKLAHSLTKRGKKSSRLRRRSASLGYSSHELAAQILLQDYLDYKKIESPK